MYSCDHGDAAAADVARGADFVSVADLVDDQDVRGVVHDPFRHHFGQTPTVGDKEAYDGPMQGWVVLPAPPIFIEVFEMTAERRQQRSLSIVVLPVEKGGHEEE